MHEGEENTWEAAELYGQRNLKRITLLWECTEKFREDYESQENLELGILKLVLPRSQRAGVP